MNIALFLAPGFEEIEALATADILRRAGLNVLLTAVNHGSLAVTGSHHITVTCDTTTDQLNAADLTAVIFPGGLPGATNLAADQPTLALVRQVFASGKLTAAICAAPVALKAAGVLTSQQYTCYPGCEQQIGGNYTAAPVQVDGNLVTGRGPGATPDFAFTILRQLGLAQQAEQLRKGMLFC